MIASSAQSLPCYSNCYQLAAGQIRGIKLSDGIPIVEIEV